MKSVCIVGSHPETRELAPYDDLNLDIWVFNEAAQGRWARRVTGVFQMHEPVIYQSPNNLNNRDHWGWLQQQRGYPVWMQDADPLVPDSVRYPIDEICRDLLPNFTVHDARVKFFTSTASYAMALAIHGRYEKIIVYGVELASSTEYFTQQAGFAFWVGVAVGRGIAVEMHSGAGVFVRPLYGYDGSLDYDPQTFAARNAVLRAEMDNVRKDLGIVDLSDSGMERFAEYSERQQYAAYLEGRANEALRYYEKTAAMVAKHKRAILDRSEFEITSSRQKDEIANNGEAATRALGWIDYSLAAYQQSNHNVQAELQLRDAIQRHINYRRKYGYHLGIYDENVEMLKQYDEILKAAGGEKSAAILREATQ